MRFYQKGLKAAQSWTSLYFDDEQDLKDFIEYYEETKRDLKNFCTDKNATCILNKRHYLILAAMQIKKQTVISKKKNDLKVGSLANLYDQTYFITVRITKITEINTETSIKYAYDFELAE